MIDYIYLWMIYTSGLENIAIRNVKGVDQRCGLWSMTKMNAINKLNNSKVYDKGTL